MRTILLVYAGLVFILLSCNLKHPVTSTNDEHLDNKIDSTLTNLVKKQISNLHPNTEFAVALTSNDSIFYYGIKNVGDRCIEIDNHLTLFEIGSITKVFTSHLLVHSAQENKLKLDQTIDDFFEFDMKDYHDISLKELSSHTSGLPTMPDYFLNPVIDSINPYKDYNSDVLVNDLKNEFNPIAETRGRWTYSNYGVSLLGKILELANERSYDSLLKEKITDPLGLSYTTTKRSQLKSTLAPGINEMGKPTANWDMEAITPAGGILSNVRDLAHYSINVYSEENTVFPIQSQKIISQPNKNTDQALGWMIYNRKTGEPYCYFHAGQTGGYTSMIMVQPKTKKSVSILSNFSDTNNTILILAFQLIKGLINGKY